MKTSAAAKAEFFGAWSSLFSAAEVRALEATGWDLVAVRYEGPYVLDTEGRRFLDCHTGPAIANLGHRPATVVEALKCALRLTDQGNFPMISREKATAAQALAAFVPADLPCVMWSVMRGEALDFACKLCRGYTGRAELLAAEGSWFGETGFALSLSQRADRSLYEPLVPETRRLPVENEALLRAISRRTAAVFLEPIQAENHCRAFSRAELVAIKRRCEEVGALLVFDETQTGFGRTGRRFAFEHVGVEPHVLVVGEALGAGLFPIAATVYQSRLNDFMNAHPLIHLSTFGGSDLGCAVAIEAVEAYRRQEPWRNAARLGQEALARLSALASGKGSLIRGVAGQGLLVSLDLQSPEAARRLCRRLSDAGVLAAPARVAERCVLLRPALILSDEDLVAMIEAVAQAAQGGAS